VKRARIVASSGNSSAGACGATASTKVDRQVGAASPCYVLVIRYVHRAADLPVQGSSTHEHVL
jgi:hypothetical protein